MSDQPVGQAAVQRTNGVARTCSRFTEKVKSKPDTWPSGFACTTTNMQPTRLPASLSTVRKLFGGAILCDVPARFIDVRCAFFLATVVCLVWRPAEAFSFAVFFDKCRTIKKCSQTLIQIRASLSRSSSIKPSRMMAAHSKSLCSFGGWLYSIIRLYVDGVLHYHWQVLFRRPSA